MIVSMRVLPYNYTITNTFIVLKKINKKFKNYFWGYFLNIFETNFYMVIKRGANRKRLYSTSMQHDYASNLC